MKHLRKFVQYVIENIECTSKESIVGEYTAKYNSDFYNKFIERFPKKQFFKDKLWDYFDEPDFDEEDISSDEEDISSEDLFNKYWNPEAEVNMLESEVGEYPGDEIWIEFYNALSDSNW